MKLFKSTNGIVLISMLEQQTIDYVFQEEKEISNVADYISIIFCFSGLNLDPFVAVEWLLVLQLQFFLFVCKEINRLHFI